MVTSVKSFSFLLSDEASKPDHDMRRENFRDMYKHIKRTIMTTTQTVEILFFRTNEFLKNEYFSALTLSLCNRLGSFVPFGEIFDFLWQSEC